MDHRSLSRELSLISLGLINDNQDHHKVQLDNKNFETIFASAIESMVDHCREELGYCETILEKASNNLLESELCEEHSSSFEKTRKEINESVFHIEKVMNILSDTLDFPKLIAISDQLEVSNDIKNRITTVVENIILIDRNIDTVMESWRFKRLPRIDRDILRLAYVDINFLNIPVAVACNEAVNLANKYSDTQGRKMINGVLRRLQDYKSK